MQMALKESYRKENSCFYQWETARGNAGTKYELRFVSNLTFLDSRVMSKLQSKSKRLLCTLLASDLRIFSQITIT